MSLTGEQVFAIVGGMEGTVEDLELPDVGGAIEVLRRAVGMLGDGLCSAEEATALVEAFAEAERVAQAGRTLAARVVERSGAWKKGGYRTAAHWLAEKTDVPVGRAVGALQTARALESLPATTAAFCSGELSEAKVKEVASAAGVAPSAEDELLAAARTQSVGALTETCRRVRAAAAIDEREAHHRIHRSRYLRHWTDPEGAFRLEARMTVQDGATVLAGLEPHRSRLASEARSAGRRESSEAIGADALVALARAGAGTGSGPRAMIHIRVDHAALVRGHTERGELCEVPGIGPVPVAAVEGMASDSILKVVLARGAEVTAVAHLGRRIPAKLRTALEERDPVCVVPECDVREGLEIDHNLPVHRLGPTTLDNLARLCRWHHYLKTFHGYRLGGGPGAWTWEGPDPPPD